VLQLCRAAKSFFLKRSGFFSFVGGELKKEKLMKNRSLPVKPRILLLFSLLCAAVASWQTIHAASIAVTNANDSGAGSLRWALESANDGDTIYFDLVSLPATITLTSYLSVHKSVTINGPAAHLLAVNGNGRPLCSIESGIVTISGLTFTNGAGIGITQSFRSSPTAVTLNNCTVSGNSSGTPGGGIDIYGGQLTLNNCVVSNNSTTYDGGGISIRRGYQRGGLGIGTTVTVNNSTISGNSASNGGGIKNDAANGEGGSFAHLVINNSTISGCGATVSVSNSTISGNSAAGAGGGGIYNRSGHGRGVAGNSILIVKNSTISGNSGGLGGGIYNDGQLAMLTIGDTILKTGASAQNIYNIDSGRVTSLGYNLSSDNGSGLLTGPGDQINTDPQISALQNNGGPTLTHALLNFSPAIDHGNPGFTPPPDEDQRGCPFDRVFNNRIDVGSLESQPQPHSPPCPTPRPRPTPGPR
jgi:hypothetical protein